MARTGRPKTDNPRSKEFSIRLTVEENAKLEKYASEHNLTKTQTMVKGIELLIEQEKNH